MSKQFNNKEGQPQDKIYFPASPVLFKAYKTEDLFKVDEVGAASEQIINGQKLMIGTLKCTPLDETQNKISEQKGIFPMFSTLDLNILEGEIVLLTIQTNKFDKSTFVVVKGQK